MDLNAMKRIIIRDLGPIAEADIFLKDVNVVIGEQSIGKSCVLKVSCFCTWVEKRIAIEQNARRFEKKGVFIEELVNFHRLNGYVHENTYIGYESDYNAWKNRLSSFDCKKRSLGFSVYFFIPMTGLYLMTFHSTALFNTFLMRAKAALAANSVR